MKDLTFKKLRKVNVKRCEKAFHKLHDWNDAEWSQAVMGELGEACNFLKKKRRGENIKKRDIAYELADTVIYLDLLAASLGIDLGKVVAEKFNIVSDRKKVDIKL